MISVLPRDEFASPSSHSSASYLFRAEYLPNGLFENHILTLENLQTSIRGNFSVNVGVAEKKKHGTLDVIKDFAGIQVATRRSICFKNVTFSSGEDTSNRQCDCRTLPCQHRCPTQDARLHSAMA